MIYGIAVHLQFAPDAPLNTILDAICAEGFFSLKGIDLYEKEEKGIGGVGFNIPLLPEEKPASIPLLTTVSAPILPPPRVQEGESLRPGLVTLSGEAALRCSSDSGHPESSFFRERDGGFMLRILHLTVSMNQVGNQVMFFSSSHVWLSKCAKNPLREFADANLSRLESIS